MFRLEYFEREKSYDECKKGGDGGCCLKNLTTHEGLSHGQKSYDCYNAMFEYELIL